MKRTLIVIFLAGYLVACHDYKKDTERLSARIDSLQTEAGIKDSSIVGFLNDFNEIQANLDSIKRLEDLVTVRSAQGREMSPQQRRLIVEDIELISSLLQENKKLTDSLQQKLNNTNFRIGKLHGR